MRMGTTTSRRTVCLVLLAAAMVLGAVFSLRAPFLDTQPSLQVATPSDAPRPKLQGIAVRHGAQVVLRAENGQAIPLELGAGTSDVSVTRNNQHVALDQIQDGDLLNVALNHDGTAYRVDALSAASPGGTVLQQSSWWRTLPLVFAMAGVGLATLILVRSIHRRRHAGVRVINDTTGIN